MQRLTKNSGIAFVGMLIYMVVLAVTSAILVAQTVNETRIVRAERENAAAFFAAQAGSQDALRQLDILINTHLQNTIAAASPSGVINFATSKVGSQDGIGWLAASVRENNVPILLQNGTQAEFSQAGALNIGSNYLYLIIITEKTAPLSAGLDAWDFPFNFQISSQGTSGGLAATVMINGDFTVRVQRDNFAKFALFTNRQTTQAGVNVWFTDKTNFYGPVHTNNRFNFALNPSGSFAQRVTQNELTARFHNGGTPVLLNADFNGTTDVPVFHSDYIRDAGEVSFSSSTQEQHMVDQAAGGMTISSNGIYVPASGGSLTGGIYIHGNGSLQLSVDGNNNAVYTITQGAQTKQITVNQSAQQTTVLDVPTGTSQVYNGLPNGMDNAGTIIYTKGNITSLRGTVQSNTEITIASSDDIVITNHLRYADHASDSGTPGTPGYIPPSATGTNNLLGLVSWGGHVRIGTAAPNNVDVHSTVMAQNGVFQVDNYDQGSPRGTATLLGGMISDSYGAFGLFNSSTGAQSSGYGRNFVYDERMLQGKSPPYFPTLNTFIAFTNDITDKLVWQEGQ